MLKCAYPYTLMLHRQIIYLFNNTNIHIIYITTTFSIKKQRVANKFNNLSPNIV